jgi:PPE-repeat protein
MAVQYWGITPEVNAFRLTCMGAGSAAHVPQVAGYQTASETLIAEGAQQTATAMVTSATWMGTGGIAMTGAVLPSGAWHEAAAAHAQAASETVASAGAAHATASLMTVPHPVVIANRVREVGLEASNILGQNAIPIAETNAEYGEFWGQNAGAMTGYFSAAMGLISALSVPLVAAPQTTDPLGMAAGLGSVAAQAAGTGVQALGSELGDIPAVGSTVASSGAEVASGASSAAGQAGQTGQAGQQGANAGAPGAPSAANPQAQQPESSMMGSAQSVMGPLTQAPQMLSSAAQPLSEVGQLPMQFGSQLGGLMGPMMSAAGGGFGAGPGGGGLLSGTGAAAGGLGGGLGGANGGYALGGSAVSAALTRPSAGAGMAGPVGMPANWWSAQGAASAALDDEPAAGVRGGAPPGAMGPGMMGVPGGAQGRRQSKTSDADDADKSVLLGGVGDGVPVLTDDGVVYAQGQGV